MTAVAGVFPDRALLALCERFSLWLRQGGGLAVRGRPLPGRALPGLDFEGFAEYTPGREVRHIDWTLYARTRRLYVREYADEGAGLLAVLLDASGSMAIGAPAKLTLARGLAAVLVFAGLRELHQVAVGVQSGGRTLWLPPTAGLDFAPAALRFLGRFEATGATDLAAACASLPVAGARGDAVLISDFLDPRGAEAGLKALTRLGFRVDLCRVTAADEFEPPPAGAAVRDPEGEGWRPAPTGAAREKLAARIAAHHAALVEAARRHEALLIELDAATPLPQALEVFFRRVAAARGR